MGLPASEIEKGLLRMEASGTVLRGKFTGTAGARAGAHAPQIPVEPRSAGQPGAAVPTKAESAQTNSSDQSTRSQSTQTETEWCERRLLARIHRLTVGMLRKQIEPVTAAAFMRWLMRWQHVAPGTQVVGERGTLEVLQQLQGFEIPANAWERQVLARRIADYDPKWLDQLCLTGAVGWGRLSPHPATIDSAGNSSGNGDAPAARQRRVIPTSVAPITFFVREEADWMSIRKNPHPATSSGQAFSQHQGEVGHPGSGLSHGAQLVLEFLRQRGASFFADIVRGTGKLKAEIETGLWELVAAGLVTADGFDNLRALIDPKRRAGQGSGKMHASATQFGAVGVAACGCGGGEAASGGGGVLDAAATVWNCDSRFAGAGVELAAVARIADGIPTARGSRRDSRGAICGRIPRRAVCPAGRGRIGPRDAKLAVEWGDDDAVGGGSVESGRDFGARGEGAGDLGSEC